MAMLAMSISEARQKLFELRERVVSDHDQVIMTHKNGNVVLISMAEWEAHQEALRLLRDEPALRALLQSFADHDAARENRGRSPEDVFKHADK
jgi:prevent-host-death family protein